MNGRHSVSSASSTSNAVPLVSTQQQSQRHGPIVNNFPQNQQHSSPSPHSAQGAHQPSSVGEWQLFTVLQRANLLQYYDTFISQGGDDVNQLLEAGEEEFLEIMALVGMASKPLHVRRLQKSLHEYSVNPGTFQLLAIQKCGVMPSQQTIAGVLAGSVLPPPYSSSTTPNPPGNPLLSLNGIVPSSVPPSAPSICNRPASAQSNTPQQRHISNSGGGAGPSNAPASVVHGSGANAVAAISITSDSPGATSVQSSNSSNIWPSPRADAYDLGVSDLCSANGSPPTLTDGHIQRLAECAIEVVRQTPDTESKSILNKKRIGMDLLAVMELSVDSPYRLHEFRRFSAIYGRFDAKRKTDRPLTFHEALVNEAAAQICLHRPYLLARRDELFPLARLVVKEAGFANAKSIWRGKSDQEEVVLEGNALTLQHKSDHNGNTEDGDSLGSPTHSRSSAGQASPSAGALTISLSPPATVGNDARPTSLLSPTSTGPKRQKRRLEEIGMELRRVSAAQEACKRRVTEAQEMADVIYMQRELNRLTQKQLELSNEEAALKSDSDSDQINGNRQVASGGSIVDKCGPFGQYFNNSQKDRMSQMKMDDRV